MRIVAQAKQLYASENVDLIFKVADIVLMSNMPDQVASEFEDDSPVTNEQELLQIVFKSRTAIETLGASAKGKVDSVEQPKKGTAHIKPANQQRKKQPTKPLESSNKTAQTKTNKNQNTKAAVAQQNQNKKGAVAQESKKNTTLLDDFEVIEVVPQQKRIPNRNEKTRLTSQQARSNPTGSLSEYEVLHNKCSNCNQQNVGHGFKNCPNGAFCSYCKHAGHSYFHCQNRPRMPQALPPTRKPPG